MTNHPAPSPSFDPKDPANYDWVPVARRPRHDGWSPELQQLFITTLTDTGSVAMAAKAAGKTRQSAYAFRRTPAGAAFAGAWRAAMVEAAEVLLDIAFDRAVTGQQRRVLDAYGTEIDVRTSYSNGLLMSLIRAHHQALGRAAATAAGVLPIHEALALLAPEEPVHDTPEGIARLRALVDDPVELKRIDVEMRTRRAVTEAAWGERHGDDPTPGTVGPPIRRQAPPTRRGLFIPMPTAGGGFAGDDDDDYGDDATHAGTGDNGDADADAAVSDYRNYGDTPASLRSEPVRTSHHVPGKREMARRRKAMARAAKSVSGVKIESR